MILDASRDIYSLLMGNGETIEARGIFNTRIVPYHENGETAHVIWFEVWGRRSSGGEDFVLRRVNSKFVQSIQY